MTTTTSQPPAPPPPLADSAHALRAATRSLRTDDGLVLFNWLYLAAIESFEEPSPAAGALAARLTRRYLDALAADDTGAALPACWRPLLRSRRHPSVRGVQFALSGVHAMAAHDLPLALLETCRLDGLEPPAIERDYARIGELLAGVEERVREELTTGPEALVVTEPLAHLVGAWSLDRALRGAWAAFRALWELRAAPSLAAELAERLDADAGTTARCLLTPLPR
ncbi:DUF5995 family protein [Streptomyces xiaopingdaonensis]|uniref:DUF5995 family protein n=1 Tax=Streptomyces xiaopingdaonensis TaxID=1565415 RepID=UPI0002EAE556|nr:DUF5995 family protein [Streptomyces xiaopingdaonensis]